MRVRRKSDLTLVAEYEYDANGRRTAKTVGSATTRFYWIGHRLAMEYDGAGMRSRRHYDARSEVVAALQRDLADLDQDGSTTDYVMLTPVYDGARDCVAVLDHTGAVAESYVHRYDGAVTIANAAGTSIATSAVGWQQGYGGLYRDDETGFLYAVNRYYSPSIGRFTSEDPAGRWYDDANLGSGYAWVGNSYRNAWDPLGLKRCCGKKFTIAVTIKDKAGFVGSGTVKTIRNIHEMFHVRYPNNGVFGECRSYTMYGPLYAEWMFSSVKDQMRRYRARKHIESKAKEVRDAFRKAGTNPCFVGYSIIGHGQGKGKTLNGKYAVYGLPGSSFTAEDALGTLDHRLAFGGSLGCGLAVDPGWANNVDNYVGSDEDVLTWTIDDWWIPTGGLETVASQVDSLREATGGRNR